MWDPISAVFLIHSSMGADLAFKGIITLLYSEWAFSNTKDSINICLTSGSDTILFIADSIFAKKKSVKASLGPCIILVNDSVLFPDSSTLPQAFKVAVWRRAKWDHQIQTLFTHQFWPSLIALLYCSVTLASSFHLVIHCYWGPTSNIAVAKSF